jgi:hypothetical protein
VPRQLHLAAPPVRRNAKATEFTEPLPLGGASFGMVLGEQALQEDNQ